MISVVAFWDGALAFAEGQRDSEFLRRMGAGRLFYAAFHDVAEAVGYPEQGEGSHEKLVRRARESQDKYLRRLAGHLDTLRLKRQKADYRLTTEFAVADLDELCRRARSVRGLLDQRRAERTTDGRSESDHR